MGNGPSDCDIRNDCNFRVDRFDKVVGAGFKSNDRCTDAGYEWVGSYDARLLTRFRLDINDPGEKCCLIPAIVGSKSPWQKE